jgi:hypothetical protein
MSQLDLARVAVFPCLNHRDQIEAQQSQIVQVILRQALAAQMGVNETKTAEASGSAAEPSDFRQLQACGVPQDHIANDSVAGEQNADLTPKLAGERGEMSGQLRRNNLLGRHTPAEGPFQGALLGLFDP